MPLNIGILEQHFRDQHVFSRAEEFGAVRFHNDLVNMALTSENIVGLDIYVQSIRAQNQDVLDNLARLRSHFSTKSINSYPSSDVVRRSLETKISMLAGGPKTRHFADLRSSVGIHLYPITTFIHSWTWPNLFDAFLGLFLSFQPYDVIVTPSIAALKVLRNLLEAMRVTVDFSLNSQPSIELIPYGYDPQLTGDLTKQAARSVLKLPPDAFVICYLGRLSPEFKADLEPLLLIFRELAETHLNLHLLLAGQDVSGSYSGRLASAREDLGLSDKVTIIANFPPLAKLPILRSADLFVSPADNIQESFGLALIDAMACGLPVVASDWSGYRDIVRHGVNGFLVPTILSQHYLDASSLIEPFVGLHDVAGFLSSRTVVDCSQLYQFLDILIRNSELRHRMGEEGRRLAESDYSWKTVIEKLEHVWVEQQRQFSGLHRQTFVTKRPLAMSRLFEAFPSHHSLGSEMVSLAEGRWANIEKRLRNFDESLRKESEKITSILRKAPCTWNELAELSPETRDALTWLAKVGAISIEY